MSKINKNEILFQVIVIGCAIFALGVAIFLIFFAGDKPAPPEQAIYWFIVSLVAAILPWVKVFKWGDLELILQTVQRIDEKLSVMRYANLVYMIDKAGNLAVVFHPKHKVWLPCGRRLDLYETPHLGIYKAVSEELGLSDSDYEIWPRGQEITYDETDIVPKPYQVQWEHNEQRKGEEGESIKSHYDFVYVCTTNKVRPILSSSLKARWLSLRELQQEIEASKDTRVTFKNVEKTFEKILIDMGKIPHS